MKFKIVVTNILLTTAFFISINYSQDRISKLDEYINRLNEYKLFNGVVLVAEKGKIIFEKSVGNANMEWKVPHTIDSKFQIASISKQFTCMLVLQLVNERLIDLEGKINDYLPDYPAKQGSIITIRNLMCHSSGIPDHSKLKNWYTDLWLQEYTTAELLALFQNLDLEFAPGSRYSYCRSGYTVLAAIIEKVCGKPLDKVLRERIFLPLKMKDSGCIDINSVVYKMSSPYEYWNFNFTRSDYMNPTTTVGGGSIYSTAYDMLKWHKALTESKLIPSSLTKQMMTEQIKTPSGMGYGFGLILDKVEINGRIHDFIGHTGAYPGFNSMYMWEPATERVILMFNNTGYTKLISFRNEITKILEDESYVLIPSIAILIDDAESKEDIEKLLLEFISAPDEFECEEDELRRLGYKLFSDEKKESGLIVLKFNSEIFPKSSSAHRSLGWAYLQLGQTVNAIKELNISLEIDPANESAKEILNKITKE
jgi:CubicO group peptidase (beta-lactamase class C family)